MRLHAFEHLFACRETFAKPVLLLRLADLPFDSASASGPGRCDRNTDSRSIRRLSPLGHPERLAKVLGPSEASNDCAPAQRSIEPTVRLARAPA